MVVTTRMALLVCLCLATSLPMEEAGQELNREKVPLDEVNGTRIDRPVSLIEGRGNNGTTAKTENRTDEGTTAKTENWTEELRTTTVARENQSNDTTPDNGVRIYRIYDYAILSWMKDSYVMSFVVPIAVGIGCAVTLIVLINLGRCVRSKCQRRRRKKFSNDTVRKMNLADRMKLLAETSDEEF